MLEAKRMLPGQPMRAVVRQTLRTTARWRDGDGRSDHGGPDRHGDCVANSGSRGPDRHGDCVANSGSRGHSYFGPDDRTHEDGNASTEQDAYKPTYWSSYCHPDNRRNS